MGLQQDRGVMEDRGVMMERQHERGVSMRLQQDRGTTLVEIMVSLAVLSLIMGSIFQFYISSQTTYMEG